MGRPPKVHPPRRANPLTNIRAIRKPTPLARQAIQGVTKSRRLCPNKTCTSPKVEDGICKSCGTIIEESNIVAEVQFGENSSGAAVVQGSFVGADQGTAKSLGPAFRRAGGMEDREKTIREGRRLMQGFGGEHGISESVINSGVQIFKLATMNNFIQGRRMNMVAAVCLYTACRKEKPCKVMLIDFADSCGVNVFKLGHCFKALHEKVTLSKDGIQPVLPEDLIYRFAAKLEFGNKTTAVAEAAVRLVQRMSKDWMVMGRRPSGVCGASLILAARMFNFRRNDSEVVYIVKVTTATIQKRLDEFKRTASSQLTIEDFLSNQFLESAHDPPSFYEKSEAFQAQKKTRKRKRALELGEDEAGREIGGVVEGSVQQNRSNTSSLTPELDALPQVEYLRDEEGFIIPPPPRPKAIPIDPSLLAEPDDPSALDALAAEHGDADPFELESESEDEDSETEAAIIENEISEMINDPNTIEHAKAFATAEQRALVHIMIQNALHPPKDVPMTTAIDDTEFEDDPEVSNCLLSADEAAIKEQIWLNANKDWVRRQQQKEFKKKMEALGPPKATRKRVKKPRIGEGQTSVASSPAEAAVDFMKNRSWSKRINYDAVKGLFDDQASGAGSATTSRVTSRAGSTVASSVAEHDDADGSDASRSVGGSVTGGSIAGRSILLGSVTGRSFAGTISSAMSSDVGNALLGELGEDPDENWQYDLED